MDIKFKNTLTSKKEVFEPINEQEVLMYNCGPTVYARQHIGNLSMFVFTDVLKKILENIGKYKVKQVINFTDFGHLTGDNEGKTDEGEDKMTKGLRAEGLSISMENMKKLAEKYALLFKSDLEKLNIDTKSIIFPFASDFIEAQIKMIQRLEENGFTYLGKRGLYFNTKKFKNYGKLGKINLEGLEQGNRVQNNEKINPTDFILWKSIENSKITSMGWQSPWGIGFPGWHIECSAMIFEILGEQIDIHTGGIEHIGVHHNNEIAQSESASGKVPFSKFWLHRAHIKIDDAKIGKSNGNVIYIEDLINKKIHPISFRLWLLSGHYTSPTNFTWDSLFGNQKTLEKVIQNFKDLPDTDEDDGVLNKFNEIISDDIDTPKALAFFYEMVDKKISKKTIEKMSEIFNIGLKELVEKSFSNFPEEISELKKERDEARINKDWQKSDLLREEIEKLGFFIDDKKEESVLRKSLSLLI